MEKHFRELLSIVKLPNLDMILSLEDSADRQGYEAPIYACAKDGSLGEPIFLLPDFEALEGHGSRMREVYAGTRLYPWKKKEGKGFWRGVMTGSVFTPANFIQAPRSQLISQSIAHLKVRIGLGLIHHFMQPRL